MQDRFKYRVKFETDGQVEIFDVTKLDMELGQVFFKREDGQYYNIGIGCKDVELMQCTGLKDKNGKLIYEEDIIEFTDNVNINGSKTHIAKVEHREEFNTYMYHAECMGWYTINPSQNEIFKVKVIGNIYENEELLNGNNP